MNRRLAPPILLALGYALLLVAWALANPPFAAPDEPAHYLRAIEVGSGAIEGGSTVVVPGGLWTTTQPACNAQKLNASAACVNALRPTARPERVFSRLGAYPPLAYVLPGLAERAASNPIRADRAGRLAVVAMSITLMLGTIFLLWDPVYGPLSLLGLVLAITPMVLFVSSIVNSSALETCAGLAFAAALARWARGTISGTRIWIALGALGAILALSRGTGALWVVLDLIVFASLIGLASLRTMIRQRPRAAAGTLAVLLAAIGLNRAWEAVYGSDLTRSGPFVGGWAAGIGMGFEQLPRVAREWVGNFGWLDSLLPLWAYLLWLALLAGLLVGAVRLGTRRERIAVLAAVAFAVGSAVVLSASLRASQGFDVQARHVLPFLVVIPLVAGEVVVRHGGRKAAHLVFGVVPLVAVFQVGAFYENARRQAVGANGRFFFLGHAQWSPPLGWTFWLGVALLGAACLTASVLSGDALLLRKLRPRVDADVAG